MGMELSISRALLDAIRADVAVDPARERCGLLLGQANRCLAILPAANVHPAPERHFEVDPAVVIAAERAARAGSHRVIGHYHSHPAGRADPSPADADAAAPDGRFWLILAGSDCQCWRSGPDGARLGRFDRVSLRLRDDLSESGPPHNAPLASVRPAS